MLKKIGRLFKKDKKEGLKQRLSELTNKDFFVEQDINSIELLLKGGINLNYENSKTGHTLLTLAIKSKEEPLVKRLLAAGADPNYYSKGLQDLPLTWAVQYQELGCVELLLASGANPKLYNKNGQTALHLAIWNYALAPDDQENGQILRLLSQTDLDLREKRYGRTALMIAANYGLCDVVDLLLKNGANPNLEDKAGMTAYKFAEESVWTKSDYNRTECMRHLHDYCSNEAAH
jgi:ankyrin repeat protein